MSKQKAPSLPSTPTYFQDPLVSQANQSQFNLGQGLTSGDIYAQNPWLNEAVSMNPQMTQLMLQGLQAQLAMPLQQNRQDTINALEANNQLTGSTTASALGNIDQNYTNQLVSAGAEAGMADINRALQNRVSLFGAGLNSIQSAGQGAQSASNAQNSFNLENYQNQVAKVLGEQKQQSGGLFGGLVGAAGGAITGAQFGQPILGAIGGAAAGGFGPQGSGGALFQAGAGLAGSRLGNSQPQQTSIYSAGAAAPESINFGLGGFNPQTKFSAGGWF